MEKEETRIGFEIKTVANLMRREMDKTSSHKKAVSITGTHGWVIGYLMRNRGRDVFQRDLEQEFSIRRSTVSNILQLMESKGLIRREPVDYDGRLKKLVPTRKAEELHMAICRDIDKMEEQMAQGIEKEELEAFARTLEKIKRNLNESEGKENV